MHIQRDKRKKKNNRILQFISVLSIVLIALVGWTLSQSQESEQTTNVTNRQSNAAATKDEDVEKTVDEASKVQEEAISDSSEPVEKQQADLTPEKQTDTNNTSQITKSDYNNKQQAPSKPTSINGILIVNKQYPLPADYNPGVSAEAQQALDNMLGAAAAKGFKLTAFSAFRSYDYQQQLYTKYVNRDGQQAADRYSARPGHSEHQTGLAFDIGEVGREDLWLTEAFGETTAGQWLQNNAYKYGFILRYPKGKETITGFMHESWHFRYVGEKDAKKIYDKNITLEEYLGL